MTLQREILKAPYPFFGGKYRAADEIWNRFGDVENYCEPFFGSGAVLLLRPHEPKIETVNDIDHNICNFWRAVKADPDLVAWYADDPVNECDLEARHFRLVSKCSELASLLTDPDAYDAKLAAWWCHGLCSWIGSGWCSGEGPWRVENGKWVLRNAGQGVNRQLPHMRNAGQGVNRQLPHMGDAGKGVGVSRQLPHLTNCGGNLNSERVAESGIASYLRQLSDRLRRVRVACGDWTRVCTPSVTHRHGMTGVLLDPPYGEGELDYAAGGNRCAVLADAVRSWAIEEGRNPLMRIALCSYGAAPCPEGWTEHKWTAAGGYSSTAEGETQGKENRHKETIFFSPACLPVNQPTLFGMP